MTESRLGMNNDACLKIFIAELSTKFSLKDLGNLHYYLGVEVIRVNGGLFITQH